MMAAEMSGTWIVRILWLIAMLIVALYIVVVTGVLDDQLGKGNGEVVTTLAPEAA